MRNEGVAEEADQQSIECPKCHQCRPRIETSCYIDDGMVFTSNNIHCTAPIKCDECHECTPIRCELCYILGSRVQSIEYTECRRRTERNEGSSIDSDSRIPWNRVPEGAITSRSTLELGIADTLRILETFRAVELREGRQPLNINHVPMSRQIIDILERDLIDELSDSGTPPPPLESELPELPPTTEQPTREDNLASFVERNRLQ